MNGKAEPAFAFYVNGQDTQGEERFGEEWGVMLATDIPKFFCRAWYSYFRGKSQL